MNKFIVTLIAGLFASAAFAQAPAPATTVAPVAAAKSAPADAKTVKPVVKADAAPVAAGVQGKAVKTHHHAKAKAHPLQAKADSKTVAPK